MFETSGGSDPDRSGETQAPVTAPPAGSPGPVEHGGALGGSAEGAGIGRVGSSASSVDHWVELQPGVWVEAGNAVWFEHDWSDVPVRRFSNQGSGSGSGEADNPAEDAGSTVGADAGVSAGETTRAGAEVVAGSAVPDWSNVDPSEPPAGWYEGCRSWIDDVPAPELGPVSWLDELAPSARLMAELEGLPPDVVDTDYDCVEMVAHWARLGSYCAAKERAAAAALARRELMAGGLANLEHLDITVSQPNIAGDELALRLGMGKRAAVRLMNAGRAMNGVAIPTAEALAAGEIDAVKADIIALGVQDLSPDAALEVQELVLAKAPHLPSGSVRRELAVARAKVQPKEFEDRCADAARARRVDRPKVLPDGMASIYAIMPAVGANQVYRAIDAAARSSKSTGDSRTLDQLRADALALMGASAIDTSWIGPCPDPHDSVTSAACEPGGATAPAPAAAPPTRHRQQARPASSSESSQQSGRDEPREHPRPGTTLLDRTRSQPPDLGGDKARTGAEAGLSQPPPEPRASNDPDAALSTAEHDCQGHPHGQDQPGDLPEGMNPADAAAWSAAGAGVCPPPDIRMRVGQIGGKSAHVRVVVPLTSLMGGEGGPAADLECSDTPAHLEGYGPIPASVARALAAGGPWARMVTDPVDRSVLELTTDKYQPPAAMAALVRAAQPECVHPTCSVPSDSCDLNHRLPWPVGITSARDLDPECRRDHLLVTHAGWRYTLNPDGGRTWTTPTDHVYTEHPDGTLTMHSQEPAPPRRRLPTVDDPPPF